MKVITFSRTFPGYHPRKGEQTNFVEKIWEGLNRCQHTADEWRRWNVSELERRLPECVNTYAAHDFTPKYHTVRAGHRWKVGDWFSPRVWSGKPYNSKQIQFAPDIQIKKVWRLTIDTEGLFYLDGKLFAYPNSDFALVPLAKNDGLEMTDFLNWFKYPCFFDGQIISWNESIEY